MKYLMPFFIFLGMFASAVAQQTANDGLLLEYYQSQRFGDAYNYLKQTYPEPVNDLKILNGLAYSSQMAGKLADAEGYYQRIYDKDSTGVAVLFNLGGINMRRGNNQRALFYYKKILQKDSTNVSVYKELATLSKNTADIPASIVYLQKANKLSPEDPDVAFDLSTFYVTLKAYKQAAKVLDPALAADTANMLLLQGKAQVSFALKNYPTTIAVCQKLLAQGAQTNSVVSWLGESYYILKQFQLCINTFQLLDATHTQNETSYYYMAMSYKALKDQHKGIAFMQQAIKQGISDNVDTYYTEIGDSYDQLHQLKKAVTAYQKSLEFEEKPMTFYVLATLYDIQLHNQKQAAKYYKRYLSSKPPETEKNFIAYSKNRLVEFKN